MGRCSCRCGCDVEVTGTRVKCNPCFKRSHIEELIAAGEMAPREGRPTIETKVVRGIRHSIITRPDGTVFTVTVPPGAIADNGAKYERPWIQEGKHRPRKNRVTGHTTYFLPRDKVLICKVVGHDWFALTYPPEPRLWRCTRCGLVVDSID